MALRISSGLTGTAENGLRTTPPNGENTNFGPGASGGERGQEIRNNPTMEGLMCQYNGPNSHTDLLEFYFGHPSSVVKKGDDSNTQLPNYPKHSRW